MSLTEIGQYVNKTMSTINSWKYRNPKLLEVVELGAYCKKNNITMEKIEKILKLEKSFNNINKNMNENEK